MSSARRKRKPRKQARPERLAWIIALAVLAGVLVYAWERGFFDDKGSPLDPMSEASFEAWLANDPQRAEDYSALQTYLSDQGVGDVVPVWQLARVDLEYAEKCKLDVWRLPPREVWPNVVPALRLVRDYVEPEIGEVAVQSSYRTPELNACARGAARSKHISFHALDLWLVTPPKDLGAHYRKLCDIQERAGRATRMGLGAYYDPNDKDYNPEGRFHIDAAGYRSWGRSYTRASSLCPRVPEP